jgi:hypothetical protein
MGWQAMNIALNNLSLVRISLSLNQVIRWAVQPVRCLHMPQCMHLTSVAMIASTAAYESCSLLQVGHSSCHGSFGGRY